jgi:hypothetical protein
VRAREPVEGMTSLAWPVVGHSPREGTRSP